MVDLPEIEEKEEEEVEVEPPLIVVPRSKPIDIPPPAVRRRSVVLHVCSICKEAQWECDGARCVYCEECEDLYVTSVESGEQKH